MIDRSGKGVYFSYTPRYLGPAQKLHITLPKRVLARVDDYTATYGETRSGFTGNPAAYSAAIRISW